MSSKSLLPFASPWGEGNCPAGPNSWSGLPARLVPPVRYFTPDNGLAAEHANQALWEAQEAARRLSQDIIARDFEGGRVYDNIAVRLLGATFDESIGQYVIATRNAGGTNGTFGVTNHADGFATGLALPAGDPVWTLWAQPRSVSRAVGAAHRYFQVGTTSLRRWDFITSTFDTLTGVSAIGQNAAWSYSAVANRILYASNASNLRIQPLTPGATAMGTIYDAGAALASNGGFAFMHTPSTDVVVTTYGGGGAGDLFAVMRNASSPLSWTRTNVLINGGVGNWEVIGGDYDAARGVFVVCAARRDVLDWRFLESADGVIWTATPGQKTWASLSPWLPIVYSSGSRPIAFMVYGGAWVVSFGIPSDVGYKCIYSFDRGATWHPQLVRIVGQAMPAAASWFLSYEAPKLVRGARGFMMLPYSGVGPGAAEPKAIYVAPFGGYEPNGAVGL